MTTSRHGALLLIAAILSGGCDDPTTGTLVVTVNGLPAAAQAAVLVEGPNQFSRAVLATTTLEDLPPGEYTVRGDLVTYSHAPFTSSVTETKHQITAGRTEAAIVTYALTGGSIDLAVIGLPAGSSPRITLIGPDRTREVTSAGFVDALPPGTHVLRADTAENADGDRYASTVFTQTVVVSTSLTSTPASVTYTPASGRLTLSIDGLPGAPDPAPVTVTGPGGFVRRVGATTSIRGMSPGTYTIAAATHHETCPLLYTPTQVQQAVAITIGNTESRTVSYTQSSVPPQSLNLKIDALHLTQVTQDLGGGVPMIAGKDALLRVFGTASEGNSVRPKIRVTISSSSPANLDASEASVRRIVEPTIIGASWNVVVPGTVVQSGLTVFAEIDPDNKICESNESDNRYPATGAVSVDVRAGPTIGIRFVPVLVTSGFLGAINAGNVDDFLRYSRKIHPVRGYDADIRLVPYATTRDGFQPNDQNGSWGAVLSELSALRVAEGSGRYYHGIVRVTYNSGIAGVGIIGGKAALTWDHLPSASEIVAHELGHNYARFHAPCGNPGGPDPNFPDIGDYAGGKIGQVGYDFSEQELKVPTVFADFMSYCRPAWTSDYTYKGIFNWLTDPQRGPTLPIVSERAAEQSLLIWGRIVDGVPALEPAFEVTTRPSIPALDGPHRFSAADATGAEIFAFAFRGERIADLPGDVETFAFALPMSTLRGRTPASFSLTSRGQTARSEVVGQLPADPIASVVRAGQRTARVRWDSSRFPMLMLRDPVSGDILSFARGGDVTVETIRGELEINYSDGVRSTRRRVAIP